MMPTTPDGLEYVESSQGPVYLDPMTGEWTFTPPQSAAAASTAVTSPFTATSASRGDPLELLRNLIASQIAPARQSVLMGALARLSQLANASPQAILQGSAPQRQQVQQATTQQRRGLAQQVGPAGVGVARRAGQGVTQNAYQQLAQLFAQLIQQGQQGVQGIAEGTSAFLPVSPRTSSGTASQTGGGYDPFATAASLYGVGQLGAGLYRAFSPYFGTTPPTAMAPSLPPAPAGNDLLPIITPY
jgi:hypothetical protein